MFLAKSSVQKNNELPEQLMLICRLSVLRQLNNDISQDRQHMLGITAGASLCVVYTPKCSHVHDTLVSNPKSTAVSTSA